MNERTLLERIAAGERDAVKACLDRYGALVWSVARSLLRDEADAEECVQDVFLELWRVADRFDPTRAAESTFVTTIARRRVVDRVRSMRRNIDVDTDVDIDGLPPPPATDTGAAEDAHAASLAGLARRALAELEPERRGVLHLAVGLGLTHAEISTRTGLPLGTIKSHLRRGFAALRAHMERAEQETGMTEKPGAP